jgi:hypothetical protein
MRNATLMSLLLTLVYPAKGEHYSLYGWSVNDEKRFYNIDTWL